MSASGPQQLQQPPDLQEAVGEKVEHPLRETWRMFAANRAALAGLVIATSHYDAALANEHYARLEVLCPPPDATDAEVAEKFLPALKVMLCPRSVSSGHPCPTVLVSAAECAPHATIVASA